MSLPEKISQLEKAAKEKNKLWAEANEEIRLVEEAFQKLHVDRDIAIAMGNDNEIIGWCAKEDHLRRLVYTNLADNIVYNLKSAPLQIRLRVKDFLPKIVDKVIETTPYADLHTV